MAVFKQPGSNNWSYEFNFNGHRVRKSTKQTNRRVAEQMEAAHKTQLAKGEVGIETREPVPRLREFRERFLEAIKVEKGAATAEWYTQLMTIILRDEKLSGLKLDQIDEAAVGRYAETRSRQRTRHKKVKRRVSPATVNRELACLRRLLRLAHEWKLIQRIPRIRLLAGERQREFIINRKDEPNYLAACPGPLADVAAFLIDTGFRVGEACSLEWAQVQLDPADGSQCGFVTVLGSKAKSKRARSVPLTARAAGILKRLKPPKATGYVFRDADGAGLVETSLAHTHKRVRELLKMPTEFVLHTLRHSFGTRLGEGGADAFTIMRLMGHSSVTTSQRYVHPTPETLERAMRKMEMFGVEVSGVPLKVPIVADHQNPRVQ